MTIAAHGPRMLRIAAEHGDGWSSWGGYDVATEEAFYAVTADRSHRFDDLCVAADRDPASIRHSLVCFPPLTWGAAPGEEAVFEEVTASVMPRLRASEMTP